MLASGNLVLFTFGALVFVLFTVMNAACLIVSWRQRRFHSRVPLVGAMGGVAMCWFSPWPGLQRLWWLPVIADLGTAEFIVGLPWVIRMNWLTAASRDEKSHDQRVDP